jgi:hypothetical protein
MSHSVIWVITTLVTHVLMAREGRRAAYPRRAVREAPKTPPRAKFMGSLTKHGAKQIKLVPVIIIRVIFTNGFFPPR